MTGHDDGQTEAVVSTLECIGVPVGTRITLLPGVTL